MEQNCEMQSLVHEGKEENKILEKGNVEKKTFFKKDYYPETPHLERRRKTQTTSVDHDDDDDNDNHHQSVNSYSESSSLRRKKKAHRSSRVISKNGYENVNLRHLPKKNWCYICDLVTTLMELDWKYALTIGLGSYFFSWLFFGVLCYVAAYLHGDLPFDHERFTDGKEPCINGVHNFLTVFLYSIGTQTTIGFSEKYPSEECVDTIFLYILQIISSIAIEGTLVSIIYAKAARPAKQLTKLKFSDKAVICYRDDKLCLLFRVCDLREQQTIESKIRVYMMVDKSTAEGEIIKSYTELVLVNNGQQIIVWPDVVCHVIDETSPLKYLTNATQLNLAQFELCVSIVGTSPATTQVTEARTSYVPREIFWGQRFVNIIDYDEHKERYEVDYENFNTTISVDMACKH